MAMLLCMAKGNGRVAEKLRDYRGLRM